MLVLLSAAGLGVPVSEDLVLLIAGTLASQGVTRYVPTLLAGYVGVLFGDALIYHGGKKLGPAAYEHRLVRKVISPERGRSYGATSPATASGRWWSGGTRPDCARPSSSSRAPPACASGPSSSPTRSAP